MSICSKTKDQRVSGLNAATDNSYTTNFREAMRNANTTQVYADTIDSETPLEKSNVSQVQAAIFTCVCS